MTDGGNNYIPGTTFSSSDMNRSNWKPNTFTLGFHLPKCESFTNADEIRLLISVNSHELYFGVLQVFGIKNAILNLSDDIHRLSSRGT